MHSRKTQNKILLMKNTLLVALALVVTVQVSAQKENYTNAPNIQATDLLGNQYDLYAQLDSGYTVIIDVMATWCPPCWSWHEAGYFETMYEQYGPDGTDELRMIMVEADSRTPESLLTMEMSGNTAATTSLGDWTEGVTYPIMNADQVAGDYEIAYYPTIYAVTPNRMVFEIGRNTDLTTYQAFAQAAPGLATDDADGLLLGFQGDLVCGEDVDAKVRFQNYSTQPLNEVTLTVSNGGNVLGTETITQTLAPYEIVDLSAGVIAESMFTNGALDLEFEYTIAGDQTPDNSLLAENIGLATAIGNTLTLEFITDAYPVETAWSLRDPDGNEILSAAYTGPTGGGGADANKVFTYTFDPMNEDPACYDMRVTDSYGDGMGYLQSASDPIPGYRILDGTGEVIVEVNLYDDQVFDNVSETGFKAGAESSSTSAPVAGDIQLYPNPVNAGQAINIELDALTVGGDVTASILNAVGQTVHQFAPVAASSKLTYELPSLPGGMYMLQLQAEDAVSTLRLQVN